jgi:hypothetical protein
MAVSQELDFRARRRVLQHERDVIGLDTWNTHVTGKRLSGNHNRNGFFEAQDCKKHLGAFNIAHHDRAMVEMFYHGLHPVRANHDHSAGAERLSIARDGGC